LNGSRLDSVGANHRGGGEIPVCSPGLIHFKGEKRNNDSSAG
jgi:hypothetical protein